MAYLHYVGVDLEATELGNEANNIELNTKELKISKIRFDQETIVDILAILKIVL